MSTMEATAELLANSPISFEKESSTLTERAVGNLDTLLKENGIDYFVVGSVARYAYMGKSINEKNEIDVLVLDPNRFDDARNIFDKVEDRNRGIKIDSSLNGYMICDDKENIILKHGNLEHKIPTNLVEEKRVSAGSSKFSTLPPETLLHTYLLAGGKMREKDWGNALDFGRWINKNRKYDHKELIIFHEFGKGQWTQSPLRKLQQNWRTFVKSLPHPVKKILTEDIYNLDTIQKARKAFNNLEENMCGYKSSFSQKE